MGNYDLDDEYFDRENSALRDLRFRDAQDNLDLSDAERRLMRRLEDQEEIQKLSDPNLLEEDREAIHRRISRSLEQEWDERPLW